VFGHSFLESVHISGERSARTILLAYGSAASGAVALAFGLAAATRLDRKRLLRTFEERQDCLSINSWWTFTQTCCPGAES